MKAKKALRFLDRRVFSSTSALILLLAMIAPGVMPAFASADVLTSRSITMSSTAASKTGVSYDVSFTAINAAQEFFIDFCSDSPIYNETCTAPTDMDVTGVTGSAGTVSAQGDSTIKDVDSVSAGPVSVTFSGITNPSTVGTFYARIVTFGSSSDTYLAGGANTGKLDDGGIALSTTSAVGVSASVRESLTFCVSGATIPSDCASGLTSPNLNLGVTSGGSTALSSSVLSTGNVYTQISTNALSGAVVDLKSSATGCGGLVLNGGPGGNCYISPSSSSGFSAGTADFGVEAETSSTGTSGDTNASGDLEATPPYNASNYYMHYVAGDATGVTSTYGDPFLDTNSAPVNDENNELTFGASISNNTPAGNYSADIGLIASGTY